MKDRLENLRLFFPAEVTGAYLAIQGLLKANGVRDTEQMWFMVSVALLLAAINAALYWKLYRLSGLHWIAVISLGFLIWVLNIDLARYKDLPYIGYVVDVEIAAPTLLVFYTLITSFFEMPKRKENA